MGKEIEIQVRVENVKPLLELMEKEGKFQCDNLQIDEYYTPYHRDFTAVRPVKEWLRLLDSDGKQSLNYKHWIYDKGSKKADHCDEYETPVNDIGEIRNMFTALDYKKVVTVDKRRKVWNHKDWEVSVDTVKGYGDFVEIEYKGSDASVPKKITTEMTKFLKDLGCGTIQRSFQGYAFVCAFPDEARWEEV